MLRHFKFKTLKCFWHMQSFRHVSFKHSNRWHLSATFSFLYCLKTRRTSSSSMAPLKQLAGTETVDDFLMNIIRGRASRWSIIEKAVLRDLITALRKRLTRAPEVINVSAGLSLFLTLYYLSCQKPLLNVDTIIRPLNGEGD